jgi:hypothetical protein
MPQTVERTQTNGAQPTYSPSPPPPRHTQRQDDNSGYWAAFSLLLGMLVVVLGSVAVWMGFPRMTRATTQRTQRAAPRWAPCRAWICRT